jgi:thiol-disulfide isomerase/thioredoxin
MFKLNRIVYALNRIVYALLICFFVTSTASAQQIRSIKIDELKNLYTSGDSIYVINFWATFCKPCIEEIPFMERISKKYKSQKVNLLLVSLDIPAWYPTRLNTFVKKRKWNSKVAWLNESNADKFCPVIDSSWSGAIPATLIYNAKTGYRNFTEDQYTEQTFEAAVKQAIAQ